jgi:tetratricopeptide (TPR) repeat protein
MQTEFESATTSEDSDISGIATPTSELDAQIEAKQRILLSAITVGLQAVRSALKLPDDDIHVIVKIITAGQESHVEGLSLTEWLDAATLLALDETQQQILNVAIALAFMRESGRQDVVVSPADLDQVWSLVRDALRCTSLTWTIMRSAQGLHAIPLWSIIEDGHIQELIRLHIWLPDGVRADPEWAIHKHQPFAQSWILAGEGTDHTFSVAPGDGDNATHAEYTVVWKERDDKESDRAYKVHSKSSTIINTGKLVCVLPKDHAFHTRNMSYHVPEGIYHKTEVESDALHATILFFDAYRGYSHDAPVIGPITQKAYTTDRKPANLSVADVANIIGDLRRWEVFLETGSRHSNSGEWEEALRAYRTALHVCQNNDWLDLPRYKHVTLGRIGHMYRMLGLNEHACECLEQTVLGTPQSRFRVECAGELATVYRHMDRLEDSKQVCEEQYFAAKQLKLEKFTARAVGTLGMVNYQLFLLNQDQALLENAISQLEERVQRAQLLEDVTLEAIGQGRLALCYMAKQDHEQAIRTAQKNYELMYMQHDSTKKGFAKVFLGRALLAAGRKDDALALFNTPLDCPPIIALCKEISAEHRQYIIELIAAGADLQLRDDYGYSALECAVYNGDEETAKIIEQGLRAQLASEGGNVEEKITQYQYEATLRKGYRDIFQDKLRPVLLEASKGSTLQNLRQTYALTLAEDDDKLKTFDNFKYVRYSDFLRCGRLPRSNDGYTQDPARKKEAHQDPFVLFFSYRWIATDPGVQAFEGSPDDSNHTQYKRMLRAIEQFLDLHHEVDREQLCIWIVSKLYLFTRTLLIWLGLCLRRPGSSAAGRCRPAHEPCAMQWHDKPHRRQILPALVVLRRSPHDSDAEEGIWCA